VVIQQNPADPPPLRLEGTLAILEELQPVLINRDALTEAFEAKGFPLRRTSTRQVRDGKVMLALEFVSS
jgi:hypothetical protein